MSARHIDHRNGRQGEGNEHALASAKRDFHQVAAAEVMHCGDLAQPIALDVANLQPDQVGMEELIVLQFLVGQRIAGDEQFHAVQRLGLFARGHALEPRHDHCLGRAHVEHRVGAAVCVMQRAVIAKGQRIAGEALHPQRAAHAMRGADHGHAYVFSCFVHAA